MYYICTVQGAYGVALELCRKHRVDMNVVYDLVPERITAQAVEFVTQVCDILTHSHQRWWIDLTSSLIGQPHRQSELVLVSAT